MKLISILVGKPRDVAWQGHSVRTSIFKDLVPGPVTVRKNNVEGDEQADLNVHGGESKAVYAYGQDAYPWWQQTLGNPSLPHGAFGENLVFAVLDETTIASGDLFSLGRCELEAREPRFPCSKLGVKFGDMNVLRTFFASRRPGVYFAVIKEGAIQPGDELKLVKKAAIDRVTIAEIFSAKPKPPPGVLEKMAASTTIMPFWREWAKEKLDRLS